ncbi:MAG TPA: DUF1080 domain-containing protein [Rhizomicrobium sp.]|jgi:hypothetical protein
MKKLALLLAILPATAWAQVNNPNVKPELTEVWSPVPPKVTPGTTVGQPPSDARLLFNGHDLSNWESVTGGPAQWTVGDNEFVVAPKTGSIQTKEKYGDVQLHVEWMVPVLPLGRKGQDRGNSGIFLQGLYEVQVLDTYDNQTYVNGEAGSIYKQYAPLANALRPSPQWQSYDIVYMAPRFYNDGALAEPARMTILLNGILVQNNVPLRGPTEYRGIPLYKAHGDAPLMLQAHNNEVHFRNLWLRKL